MKVSTIIKKKLVKPRVRKVYRRYKRKSVRKVPYLSTRLKAMVEDANPIPQEPDEDSELPF